jgi:hypothetical protein
MFSRDYWAHFAPDGTSPWTFIKAQGYNYIYAGENLARGYYTAADVVNAWMESPEHRQNVLSPKYQNVGFAVSTGKLSGEDTVLIVEMLGSTYLATEEQKKVAVATTSDTQSENTNQEPAVQEVIQTPTPTPTEIPLPTPAPVLSTNGSSIAKLSSDNKSLINVQGISSGPSQAIVSLFIFILLLDFVLIERRKILRYVGHNLDHVFFLSLILMILIIVFRGSVL